MSTTMSRMAAHFAALCVIAIIPSTGLAQSDTDYDVDPALFQALEWRNIGPFRGGRVTAVAGHPDQPFTYYMGANDGGANVSYDQGRSWSTQSNQPTAQFYRVNVDNLFPYRLYGGQQDNSTVRIPNRALENGISMKHFRAVAGGESAHIAAL